MDPQEFRVPRRVQCSQNQSRAQGMKSAPKNTWHSSEQLRLVLGGKTTRTKQFQSQRVSSSERSRNASSRPEGRSCHVYYRTRPCHASCQLPFTQTVTFAPCRQAWIPKVSILTPDRLVLANAPDPDCQGKRLEITDEIPLHEIKSFTSVAEDGAGNPEVYDPLDASSLLPKIRIVTHRDSKTAGSRFLFRMEDSQEWIEAFGRQVSAARKLHIESQITANAINHDLVLVRHRLKEVYESLVFQYGEMVRHCFHQSDH